MIKWGLSQECKDSSIYANQSINGINHTKKLEKIRKISIDAKKVFNKIQHPFMILLRKWA